MADNAFERKLICRPNTPTIRPAPTAHENGNGFQFTDVLTVMELFVPSVEEIEITLGLHVLIAAKTFLAFNLSV